MNILIKLSSLVGLTIAPLIAVQHTTPTGLVVPTEKKIEVKKEVVKPTAMVDYREFVK